MKTRGAIPVLAALVAAAVATVGGTALDDRRADAAAAAGHVVPLVPARLLETREGPDDVTVDGEFQGGGAKPAGSTTVLQVAGRGDVDDDASAVFLNVTAVAPAGPGYVTVFPCDVGDPPLASNVNYAPGEVVPNLVFAKLAPDGSVCLYTHAATHLVVDVTGYTPDGSGMTPVAPARLFESRKGPLHRTVDGEFEGVGRLAAGSQTPFDVDQRAEVVENAPAAMLNVTAVTPDGPGHLTVFPCDVEAPVASNLNYVEGDVVANATFVRLDNNGRACVSTYAGTDLVVDVNGYVANGVNDVAAIAPLRLLETRSGPGLVTFDGQFQGDGRVPADSTVELDVAGRYVPGNAVAVFLNVTAVAPSGAGFVTAWPCGEERPWASNLNYTAGDVVPNAVLAKIGDGGKVCFYTHAETDLVVDVNGYVVAPEAPPADTTCTISGAEVPTSIPQVQCDALVAFYQATGGPSWNTRTGWLTSTDPCTWYGVTCEDGGVVELNYYANGLTGGLPPEIGDLTDLRILSLFVGGLTSVPAEIGNLTSLRELVLSNHALSGVPAELWTLTSLERLELASSALTSLPPQIGDLTNLRRLALGSNTLTELPVELTTLPALEHLDVEFNQITALPAGFDTMASLRTLRLSNNPVQLPDAVLALTGLEQLDLYGVGLTELPAGIAGLTNLTRLSVQTNALTSLPAGLFTLPKLADLNIGGNQLTTLPLQLADLPALTILQAGYNPWSADLTAVLQALKDAGRLTQLRLGGSACPMVTGAELRAWVTGFDPGWLDACE